MSTHENVVTCDQKSKHQSKDPIYFHRLADHAKKPYKNRLSHSAKSKDAAKGNYNNTSHNVGLANFSPYQLSYARKLEGAVVVTWKGWFRNYL